MCLGVVARGGGRRGVLRECSVSSTSGAEPVKDGWLVPLRLMAPDLHLFMTVYVLSCNSIALELDVPCACFSGEVGDEKMPDMGSMPCSSRTPVSTNMIPVLLSRRQCCTTYNLLRKPDLPTDLAYIKILVARPAPTAGRVAPNTLPPIFCCARSSHAARYLVFLVRIQCVQLCMVNAAMSRAARKVPVSVCAKQQYQCRCPIGRG